MSGTSRVTFWFKLLAHGFLIVLTIASIYPFVFMIMNAFKSNAEYLINPNGIPHKWTFVSINIMLHSANMLQGVINSVIVSVFSVILIAIISSMAGYGFSKLHFKGRNIVFLGIISCMMIPVQVIIVPLYVSMARLGATNTYWLLILLYTTLNCPFGVYLMRSYYTGIPDELIDAAQIDGLSYLRIYTKMMFRIGLPPIVTVAVLNFIGIWNDLLMALLFLQDPSKQTVTVDVSQIVGRYSTNYPAVFAGLLFASIPTILFFVIFQKQLSKGITAGIVR